MAALRPILPEIVAAFVAARRRQGQDKRKKHWRDGAHYQISERGVDPIMHIAL